MLFGMNMEIPIDKSKEKFRHYLRANDRCVLSAAFGDGKSYFLEEFKKECSDEFVFITLHPVNYQVAQTYDIFELIKRDILLQLIVSEVITDTVEISESNYLYSYLFHNDFTGYIVKILSLLNPSPEFMSQLSAAVAGKKLVQKLRESYKKRKDKIDETSDMSQIERFFTNLSLQKGSIYEYDPITSIITQSVRQYKKREDAKKLVLVIEDLDRLDPAHIFRILNVLSAHIDRQYLPHLEMEENCYSPNKYGFDKSVLVCDLENIRKIYFHFYGINANFDGYMGKFTTYAPFLYSFEKVMEEYLTDELTRICPFEREAVSKAIAVAKGETRMNIRRMSDALNDIDSGIKDEVVVFGEGMEMKARSCNAIRFFTVLKRIGMDVKDAAACTFLLDGEGAKSVEAWDAFIVFALKGGCGEFYISDDADADERITVNGLKKDGGKVLLDYQIRDRYMRDKQHKHLSMESMVNEIFSHIR